MPRPRSQVLSSRDLNDHEGTSARTNQTQYVDKRDMECMHRGEQRMIRLPEDTDLFKVDHYISVCGDSARSKLGAKG